MSVNYNPRARLVTSADISSLTLLNMTTVFNGDSDNGYVYEGYHNTGGCGTAPESGVLILLKDTIPWTRISFQWEGTGQAACWSFVNPSTAYGAATGTPSGNLLGYDAAQGDKLYDGYLTFTGPGMVGGFSALKFNACDNATDNFMRFNTETFRRFRMSRRRNVGTGLAGIHHGRSCSSIGTGSVTRISNIFIWI
jgi:hypothetical protein